MAWVATALVFGMLLSAAPAAAQITMGIAQAEAKIDQPAKGAAPPKSAASPKGAVQKAAPAAKPAPTVKPAPAQKPAPAPPKRDGQQPAAKKADPAPASAARSGGRQRCLSQNETRETVAARKLSPPFSALRTAGSHARGETIGVRLCRHNDDLFYEINVLRRDGRVVKVMVDAASGRVVRLVNDR